MTKRNDNKQRAEQVPVKTNGTQVTAAKKPVNARLIIIVTAIVLACAMLLTGGILLAVNNARTPGTFRLADLSRTQITSIAAYNEQHRTHYRYSHLQETAAYAYSDGKFDIVLEQHFVHGDGQEAVLYIQTDERDTVSNLRTYYDLPERLSVTTDSGTVLRIGYTFAGGTYTASFTADGCIYCVHFDSGFDTEEEADRTFMTVILSVARDI